MALVSPPGPDLSAYAFTPDQKGAQEFVARYRESVAADKVAYLENVFNAMQLNKSYPPIPKYSETDIRTFASIVADIATDAELKEMSAVFIRQNMLKYPGTPDQMIRNNQDLARPLILGIANKHKDVISRSVINSADAESKHELPIAPTQINPHAPPEMIPGTDERKEFVIRELVAHLNQIEFPEIISHLYRTSGEIYQLVVADYHVVNPHQKDIEPSPLSESMQLKMGRHLVFNVLMQYYNDQRMPIASKVAELKLKMQAVAKLEENPDRTSEIQVLQGQIDQLNSQLLFWGDYAEVVQALCRTDFSAGSTKRSQVILEEMIDKRKIASTTTLLRDIGAKLQKIDPALNAAYDNAKIEIASVFDNLPSLPAEVNEVHFLEMKNISIDIVRKNYKNTCSETEILKLADSLFDSYVRSIKIDTATPFQMQLSVLHKFHLDIYTALNAVSPPENMFNDEQVVAYFAKLRVASEYACYEYDGAKRIGLSGSHNAIYNALPNANVAQLIQATINDFLKSKLEHVDRLELVKPAVHRRDTASSETKEVASEDRATAQINAFAAKRKEQLLQAGEQIVAVPKKFNRPKKGLLSSTWADTLPTLPKRQIELPKITGVFASAQAYSFPEAMAVAQTSSDLAMIKGMVEQLLANNKLTPSPLLERVHRALTSSEPPNKQFKEILVKLREDRDLLSLDELKDPRAYDKAFSKLLNAQADKNPALLPHMIPEELGLYKMILDLKRFPREELTALTAAETFTGRLRTREEVRPAVTLAVDLDDKQWEEFDSQVRTRQRDTSPDGLAEMDPQTQSADEPLGSPEAQRALAAIRAKPQPVSFVNRGQASAMFPVPHKVASHANYTQAHGTAGPGPEDGEDARPEPAPGTTPSTPR